MIRRLLRLAALVAPLAIAGVITTPAGPAHACSCAVMTETEAFDHAQVVFTGELVEVRTPPLVGIVSSGAPERFVFAVDRVYKGTASREQSVVTAMEGATCGLEISGPGPFVVFAQRHDQDWIGERVEGELSAGLCGGTRLVGAVGVPASFGGGVLPEEGSSPIGGPPTSTTGPITTSTTSATTTSSDAAAAPATASDGIGITPVLVVVGLAGVAVVGLLAVMATRRRRG